MRDSLVGGSRKTLVKGMDKQRDIHVKLLAMNDKELKVHVTKQIAITILILVGIPICLYLFLSNYSIVSVEDSNFVESSLVEGESK